MPRSGQLAAKRKKERERESVGERERVSKVVIVVSPKFLTGNWPK